MSDRRKIADAKECVNRLDKYTKGLNTIIEMCELIAPFSLYNKLPDNFREQHRKDMRIVIRDLIALKSDAQEMASLKADYARELENAKEAKDAQR